MDNEEKRGPGRPKNSLKHLQEIAACNAVIWSQSLPLTVAGIELAKNGNATLLKIFFDRLYGRIEDTPPICSQLDEIAKNLPPGFDPEATMNAVREGLWGPMDGGGEWTTAEAQEVGRMGLETLKALAKRGDAQAAALLMRTWVPDPILTLGERAPTMSAEELRETMTRRYSAAWPWLPASEIERMVDAVDALRGPAASNEEE